LLRRHGRIVHLKNGDSLFLAARRPQEAIMFKRLAAGQRISPSETAATSMAPAPAPMTTSDSISADLASLETKGKLNHTASPPRPFRGFRSVLEEDIIETDRVAGPTKKWNARSSRQAGVCNFA
jgi:hypothetical protein